MTSQFFLTFITVVYSISAVQPCVRMYAHSQYVWPRHTHSSSVRPSLTVSIPSIHLCYSRHARGLPSCALKTCRRQAKRLSKRERGNIQAMKKDLGERNDHPTQPSGEQIGITKNPPCRSLSAAARSVRS
ncbi:hypothetical protein BC567DRAFT_79734 [Phyllosticta citribraziliensis]